MRKQSLGISINEPPDIPNSLFQSPTSQPRWSPSQGSTVKSQMYKAPVIDPVLTQPLLDPNEVSENRVSDTEQIPVAAEGLEVPPITVKVPENHHINPLESVLEECPLSRYFPQDDEYRPINLEDEVSKEPDEEVELSDKAEEDQHCDLLLKSINGALTQETRTSQKSTTTFKPSQRFSRSRVSRSNNVPPNNKSPSHS